MRERTKRGLSMLLAFVMCLSLLSGLTFAADAATVNYVTGNVSSKYTNVIKNWGSRGTTATFLSPNAEAFYEDNNTSYEKLSSYSGASSTSAVPNSALYGELQELMVSNHDKITSYGDTTEMYAFTDCENSGKPATISSFYSGKAIGPAWDSGATWNREHTWPNSKGLGGSDENDIMMLRPTAKSENSSRGNTAYGESSGYYNPNRESGGKHNLHGDVARIALYVYVRWGNTGNMWGTGGEIESKEVLLKWMEEDPVDTWELGRNDSVESITGTRNVFVDYPELAFLLFNEEVPADMPTPSGEAANTGYTITATVNNAAYGSVSVSGRTINAVPAAGYQVAGYTLVSGSASVTRNGNAFTVDASSDCTIRINFAARTAAAVSFYENGSEADTRNAYVGDVITLPEASVAVPGQYSFLGWITENLSETTAMPSGIYAAGSDYAVTGAVDFYALYSRIDSEGTATGSVFNLYSGALTEGDYLVVYGGGAMKAAVTDKTRLVAEAVSVSNDCVSNPDSSLVWHIARNADGYWTLYNESTASYAASASSDNKATLSTTVTDNILWTVSGTEDYDFTNVVNKGKGINANLRRNADLGFACYAQTFLKPLSLYKAVNGTVYYSTTAAECAHNDTANVAAVAATCTEPGYTAGVYCNDCASYISGHAVIEAPGHNYAAVVTPPTVTQPGYTTYTCGVCGDSYVGDHTDALGETYTVSFAVPKGVAAVEGMNCDASGILLPNAGVPTGAYEYTFAGWAEAAVENTETAPALYAAGERYVAQADTTLYAVYTYTVGGFGTGEWKLVTDASALTAGAQVVIASNANSVVASDTISSTSNKYMYHLEATFSNDLSTLTALPEGVSILTLGGSEGAWTLTNAKGQLLGATAAKKMAWSNGTTTWSITIADGNATIQNGTSTYGRVLYNVNDPRFTTYTSDTNKSMLLPQLYMMDGSLGTTYYTSVGAEAAPALFNLAGANLELANDITMYFYVYAKDVADGYYMEIVKTNADGSKVTKQVAMADWNTLGDMYYVGFNGMAAKEMADEIAVTVYNAEGTQVSNTTTTSISAYALRALDNAAYAKMHTLMADLLNYGAAAQTFFQYNTSNLANANMTETHQSYATKGFDMSKYTNDAVAGAGAMGANLSLETNILQNFYFDPSVVDSTMMAHIHYVSDKGAEVRAVVTGDKFTTVNGLVCVEVDILVPADVMSLVQVVIMDVDGNIVASVKDSIASYAVRAYGRAATDTEKTLYVELMEYCLSCEAYFG